MLFIMLILIYLPALNIMLLSYFCIAEVHVGSGTGSHWLRHSSSSSRDEMGLGFAPSSGFRLLSHGNFLILLLASYLFSALSWAYAFNYVCNGSFGFWFPDI